MNAYSNGKNMKGNDKPCGSSLIRSRLGVSVALVIFLVWGVAVSDRSLLRKRKRTASLQCSDCPDKSPPPQKLGVDQCRGVFRAGGQGGHGELKDLSFCEEQDTFNVCDDLHGFTGLSSSEIDERLRRKGRFHFEGEHAFWNPQTASELAWYYSTSVDYLFANSAHPVVSVVKSLNTSHAPVLDFSGGVGNNVLHLASKGIKTQYFGIGMMEFAFAEYRVRKRGYSNEQVTFKRPFSASTNWTFDPINAALPRDGSLGAILAIDVLEHIPEYHKVVKAMVDSLRVGGMILENTPFSPAMETEEVDLRVHVSDGGVSMADAMGSRMKKTNTGQWQKISG